MLSTLAKMIAQSTVIVGYRGAGRLFKPLASIKPLLRTQGTVRLGPAHRITFPAFDPYWAQYLWTSKPYEPDVEAILRSLAGIPDKVFVDCGANIGFWTIRVSDPAFGFTDFLAVEANPYVFDYLKRNVEANEIPARIFHAAISERSGETVRIDCTHGHAVGTVGKEGTPVQTVNLEMVLGSAKPAEGKRRLAVVKLDVEGCEIDAVKGARNVQGTDLLFIYEDWPRSGFPVSKFMLEQGYSILGVHADGRAETLGNQQELLDFNRRSFAGYHPSNLVATKSPHLFLV